ncbi:ABC transporter permease [Jatrophihabitans telluris]|uniref:ABC transporter permease n=1 Tax=Jatrophihabitans telluris TaxID=2038343 RepID=A0ABY4R1U4_9ACTN|nr:ABC transporter permease [Jatrophihabitans telluris]UQX89004.1 ABC transporter permease [Jatrophihabitans telluris]
MISPVLGFILRRLAALVVTLFVSSVLLYGVLYLSPGDPAALIAGGHNPSQSTLAAIRAEYHLSDPFWSRYWRWLSGLLQWKLGRSIGFDDQVSHLISSRATNTLFLVGYATVLILPIGIAAGTLSALRGRVLGNIVTTVTSLLMAVPTFVAAIVLIWVFATKLTWFPIFGSGSGFLDRVRHLTLPAVALACSYVAYLSRVTRSAVSAELRSEHVDTARSRGIPMRLVVRRHVLRNAAAPVLTVSGLTVAGLVAGTVVAEQAFGVSGIGSLLVLAAQKQDFVVVQDISLLMVSAFVVVNTIVDLLNVGLDPRLARTGR